MLNLDTDHVVRCREIEEYGVKRSFRVRGVYIQPGILV